MKKLIVLAGLFLVGVACSSNDNIPITVDDNPINQQPVERRCGCENRDVVTSEGVLIRTVHYPNIENRLPEHTYSIIIRIGSTMIIKYFVCKDDAIEKKFPSIEFGDEIPVRFSGQFIDLCDDEVVTSPAVHIYYFIKLDNIEAI
ncbi:hypothetical protein [Flavobacterium sp. NKUCC04_CG]|uniref:hypothetical protein n=1 Tax=Flavobacterium sp. NKUCC04_CG TaxID=2842121 RepID=UPI001C5BCF71|nr:hypothetical protein [Flavobacterium sp. NKUCC04_CG]MBW3520263.1 hypothetical protein [Flavobacterium sp. NKUCC04_CG]